MASDAYHEPLDLLSAETRDMHRALVSLMEELEAIDWYQQRIDASSDTQLKTLLLHNKHEEMEHAAMLMEWVRRHDAHFAAMMRKFLFNDAPLVETEQGPGVISRPVNPATNIDSLGIGSMRGR